MATEHDNHGNTPAAWTAVVIIIIGFTVGTIGVIVATPAVVFVGVGIVVLGAIVGKVMQMMGMGAPRESEPSVTGASDA